MGFRIVEGLAGALLAGGGFAIVDRWAESHFARDARILRARRRQLRRRQAAAVRAELEAARR